MIDRRARAAAGVVRAVNAVSRRLGVGGGTVAGGRVGLRVDPDLLSTLLADRPLALVSGTNGKTTTTRLLVAALETLEPGSAVVTNATGSNMPAGHVAALAAAPPRRPAVLEVDEGYLPALCRAAAPTAIVLLNLSRDQLDRTSEVRMLAERWRGALHELAETVVVANADDPLVTYGAAGASAVRWVSAGLRWRADAVGCPVCEGRIEFADDGPAGGETAAGWACSCGFARPEPDVRVLDGPGGSVEAAWRDGTRLAVSLRLPGHFNRTNAVLATVAAGAFGVGPAPALAAMEKVGEVAGRFTVAQVGGQATRLLLAKNPAGWTELLDLVAEGTGPVVVSINARVADGKDPSWLWDVPFEQLRGRRVVAAGDRCLDLSVRLRYAGVEHETVRDPVEAVRTAVRADRVAAVGAPADRAPPDRAPVELIGNYTAFHDVLARS